MYTRSTPWTLLLAFALMGCASLGKGKGAWHLLTTDHFALYTDLTPARARSAAQTLEAELYALHHTGWEATGDLPLKLNVVMFRSSADFRTLAGDRLLGYMLPDVMYEPWIVMPAATSGERFETIVHELTHFMAFQAMQRQPAWFAEGLAGYFQTARFDAAGDFEIGNVPRSLFAALGHAPWMPPSELLRANSATDASRFYPSAWLFVHYLMTKRPDQFAAYQSNLGRGMMYADAFETAFPGVAPADLDVAVRDYARIGVFEAYAFRVHPPATTVQARTLSIADEHALSALLWAHCDVCGEGRLRRARQDIALALAADPTHLRASLLEGSVDVWSAQEEYTHAQGAVRAHPDAWSAWVALGMAAARADKLAEIVHDPATDPGVHAPRLAPNQPFAVLMTALSYAARGERAAALATCAQAERMQPSNPGVARLCAELRRLLSAREALVPSEQPATTAVPP